jgi:hypothetical protein
MYIGEIDLKAKIAAMHRRAGTAGGGGESAGAEAGDETGASTPAVGAAEVPLTVREAVLTVQCRRKDDGHVVAAAQFVLPALEPAASPLSPPRLMGCPLEVDEGWEGGVSVRGEWQGRTFGVFFSRETGLPVQLEYEGVQQLRADGAFRLNLWRPVTDNELGSKLWETLRPLYFDAGCPGVGVRLVRPMAVTRLGDGGGLSVVAEVSLMGAGVTTTSRCTVMPDGTVAVAIRAVRSPLTGAGGGVCPPPPQAHML